MNLDPCRGTASIVAVVMFLLGGSSPAAAPDNWRKVRAAALKASRSELASEREVAFDAFRGQDHIEAAEFLVKAINSPNTDLLVRRHARDVLATFQAEECRDFLYRTVRSKPEKSHLLLEAFAGMGDERGPEIGGLAIKAGSGDEKEGAPIVAAGIRCLVSSGQLSGGAIDSVIERSGDGHPIAVRKAATDVLLSLRTPESIGALVALSDDEALAKRVRQLLVRLAGEDLGVEKAEWETWWEGQEQVPPAGELISEGRADELIAKTLEEAIEAGESPEQLTFYGVPIEGKNVVFVMDASSSMRGYPLERLQSECRRMVEKLPETHKFALVFYPKNECYPPELHLADEKTKDRAYKFINERGVIRGTPTGDAMEFAFRRFVVGQDVDAIYLLSDGRPSKPIPDVLQTIDNLNLGHYVAINTIFIGAVPVPDPNAEPGEVPAEDPNMPPAAEITSGSDFLKEVARRHMGSFTIVAL
ncbi:MAG: vWA domain-containing protein [Verrucomicrobiales bacterium]